MGKALVIKGADFSENAVQPQVVLYYDGLTEIENKGIISGSSSPIGSGSQGYGPEGFEAPLVINYIRAKVFNGVPVSVMMGNSYTDTNPTELFRIEFTSEDVGNIVEKNLEPVTLPSGKVIWFSTAPNTSQYPIHYYSDNFDKGIRYNCGKSGASNPNKTLAFSIDVGIKTYL